MSSVESKIRLRNTVQTHNEWVAYETAQHQAALIGREADQRIEELGQELYRVRDHLMYSDIDCLGDGWTPDGQKYPIRDAVIDGISRVLRSG